MRYQNLLTPLLIFGAFLLTGILVGRWLGHSFEADQLEFSGSQLPAMVDLNAAYEAGEHSNAPALDAAPRKKSAQDTRPRQRQRNVLIVGVDNLDAATPALESVWLILYIPDLPQIIWMPIYPQVVRDQSGIHIEANVALRDTFTIDNRSLPNQEFLTALKGENIWWSNFVIVDQTAVIDLVDLLGGLESVTPNRSQEVQMISGAEAFSILDSTRGGMQDALYSQANFIQRLCRIPPQTYLSQGRVLSLYQKLQGHLITDINPSHIMDELHGMLSDGGRFACDFPSLSLLSSTK